jgi:hypothetical protein
MKQVRKETSNLAGPGGSQPSSWRPDVVSKEAWADTPPPEDSEEPDGHSEMPPDLARLFDHLREAAEAHDADPALPGDRPASG